MVLYSLRMALSAFELGVAAELRALAARDQTKQVELAAVLELSQSQTSKVLRGLRPLTVGQFHAAAHYFNTTTARICIAAGAAARRIS